MEVEFDFVTHETTGHRMNVRFTHLAFNLLQVAVPATLNRHHDCAGFGQLHPKCLEFLSITVACRRELNISRSAWHAKVYQALARLRGPTDRSAKESIEGVLGANFRSSIDGGSAAATKDITAKQVIDTLRRLLCWLLCWLLCNWST